MTGLRVDKWLWFARVVRTRSLAARLCLEGCITIGGRVVMKPGHLVRPGDVLTVLLGDRLRRITVAALATHRGPAEAARRLYLEAEPPLSLSTIERAAWTPLLAEGALKVE
ncbi:MAG TPA: RNA-binding S4 domain-containing protein [Stellaceae bacterium]|nr:RNA-binding S4 domain-containing protein [Stellaceae bacterium]